MRDENKVRQIFKDVSEGMSIQKACFQNNVLTESFYNWLSDMEKIDIKSIKMSNAKFGKKKKFGETAKFCRNNVIINDF